LIALLPGVIAMNSCSRTAVPLKRGKEVIAPRAICELRDDQINGGITMGTIEMRSMSESLK
jgi:hypothetical protein